MKNKKHSFFKLSLATAGVFHLINRWIGSYSNSRQSSSANGKFYHWKQGDIFYKQFGEGKTPLLLIHELSPLHASFEWHDIANDLKEDYTVYVLDLPGCGKSDKPAITFANYYFVQMVADFVHDVIGEPSYVAATGLSGAFVLMAAQLHKDLFKHIILINPHSISSLKRQPDNRSRMIQKLFDLPLIGTTAYYIITNKICIEDYWTEKQTFNPFVIDHRILNASYDASHAGGEFGKYLLGSIDGNYVNVNISNALSSLDTPIHLILGEQVPGYSEIIKEYRSLNNNITAEIIGDCKMYPQIEMPESILESFYTYLE
jgi:pimeloyl-ACP methyl ester carboxylesterase